eukprot:TRINITY_DN198009_c1_g1_i1.p5 TRINITY_DN198009_c1_g1~~TRINITY_DN198009_c1_g1_i1.p5  ORF type:complete len:117 (-),score=3.06 TRINITY_DN198009_c1_g1_i1:212-562(-)
MREEGKKRPVERLRLDKIRKKQVGQNQIRITNQQQIPLKQQALTQCNSLGNQVEAFDSNVLRIELYKEIQAQSFRNRQPAAALPISILQKSQRSRRERQRPQSEESCAINKIQNYQ